jgi:hypothetical protein
MTSAYYDMMASDPSPGSDRSKLTITKKTFENSAMSALPSPDGFLFGDQFATFHKSFPDELFEMVASFPIGFPINRCMAIGCEAGISVEYAVSLAENTTGTPARIARDSSMSRALLCCCRMYGNRRIASAVDAKAILSASVSGFAPWAARVIGNLLG